MKSINKVIMIGNLTRDPEVVQINQNTEVAKFTIAVNDGYKKPDGEVVDVVTYMDCEAWSGLAKVVGQYVKKGSRIYIEGSLRADTWTDADSGKSRTKHKIRIAELMMLDSRGGGNGGGRDDMDGGNDYAPRGGNNNNTPNIKAVDDELPF
jgi:single-strand DNA-binding protein